MSIRFHKMHGAGNDFVVIDRRRQDVPLSRALITFLCDRRLGIGCDQLALIDTPAPDPDGRARAGLRFFNADGSESGACGNATRCVAHLLREEATSGRLILDSLGGPLVCAVDDAIWVDLGPARLDWCDIPLAREGSTLHADLPHDPACAAFGNPHATIFVDRLDETDIATLGPALETHPLLTQGANIGFVEALAPDRLRAQVWERGTGLTLACGSGAAACVVNAHRRGLCDRHAWVEMPGGTLEVVWREDGHALLSGPVAHVFTGEMTLPVLP